MGVISGVIYPTRTRSDSVVGRAALDQVCLVGLMGSLPHSILEARYWIRACSDSPIASGFNLAGFHGT